MFPRQKKQETKIDLNDKVTKEVGAVEELNSNTNSITN
jgi:hypothetical protein